MWATCVSTVRGDTNSREAMSGLELPSATIAAIARSVAVSASRRYPAAKA